MNVEDSEIKSVLTRYRKIAVYGLSPEPEKPSHYVPAFIRSVGYDVVGIYPIDEPRNDFKIYETLADVPAEYRRFLNVFRRSDVIPRVVDEVLKVGGIEVLFLQLGISHPEAEKRAEDAGIKVISNRCLLVEYKKYFQ